MKLSIQRLNDEFLLQGTNSQGSKILLDNTSRPDAEAVSPMEALLMSVAGCSAIDIIAILKKQRQIIEDFKIEINGEREQIDEAKPFRKIHVEYHLKGNIDQSKAEKAAQLSFDKYCSVSKSLAKEIEIHHSVFINSALFNL